MSNTDSSGTAGPPVIIPLPAASAPADATGNNPTSTNISISGSNVARLLSIQRELLHLTSDRPEAARLLEEMGRIVGPLVPKPDDAPTPIASDPISQVLGNPDILVHGLLFFSKAALATITRVSKRWKSVLNGVEDKLWTGVARREEPLLVSAIPGKSGRQWEKFLEWRLIRNIPRRIRQPESSQANLENYVFELEFKVVAGRRDQAAPDEDEFHYAPFRFLLSASPKNGGSIILRNDDVEDARRLKTVANTALTNSPHILGESEDDGILAQEWKLRITNKETLKSVYLLQVEENHIFRYDKESREGVARYVEGQETIFLGNLLIRTSDDDGYAIPFPGEDGCRKPSKDNRIFSSLESFLVSSEEINFHMTFLFYDDRNDDYDYDDLAFLLANLRWGYY